MSQLQDELRDEFKNPESRYAYVEAHLNASVAAQIKHFRGEMSQQELAELVGTKQSGISRLENANYSAWKVETLRKLARAFGLRLHISFEEFGTLIPEIQNFKKRVLCKKKFADDPVFKESGSIQPTQEEHTAHATRESIPGLPQSGNITLGATNALGTNALLTPELAAAFRHYEESRVDSFYQFQQSYSAGTVLRELARLAEVEAPNPEPVQPNEARGRFRNRKQNNSKVTDASKRTRPRIARRPAVATKRRAA